MPESISDSTQNRIDIRVSKLIKECLNKAINIIETKKDYFNELTNKLLNENTIIFDLNI